MELMNLTKKLMKGKTLKRNTQSEKEPFQSSRCAINNFKPGCPTAMKRRAVTEHQIGPFNAVREIKEGTVEAESAPDSLTQFSNRQ